MESKNITLLADCFYIYKVTKKHKPKSNQDYEYAPIEQRFGVQCCNSCSQKKGPTVWWVPVWVKRWSVVNELESHHFLWFAVDERIQGLEKLECWSGIAI